MGHYTKDVIGGGQTYQSHSYYMALMKLGERLMNKYNANWIGFDEMHDITTSWETRAFLDQGGFNTILKKERPNWTERNPVIYEILKAIITVIVSTAASLLLVQLNRQQENQKYEKLERRLDNLSSNVDSLATRIDTAKPNKKFHAK